MIAFVRGKVFSILKDAVVVDNNGIGYLIYVSNPTASTLHDEITLFTYQHVREDAITLFGFPTQDEQDVFMRLISVKGVGPKTALTMLGVCPVRDMIVAIEQNDVTSLKKLPGIGAKTAQQIVLDLKGKLVEPDEADVQLQINNELMDAMDALKALGYKAQELTGIKKELSKQEKRTTDEYIRLSLGMLAKRKGV